MINAEIVNYIQAELKKGVDRQLITHGLLANGWSAQDVDEAFNSIQTGVSVGNKEGVWGKGIPKTNNIFGIIFLLLVFGLDLAIVASDPSLAEYWYFMLGVFGVFVVFYYFENYSFRKSFRYTSASADGSITVVIAIRNIIFLLNFIPVIQLLGLMLLMQAGLILLGLYIFLIIMRFRQTHKKTTLG